MFNLFKTKEPEEKNNLSLIAVASILIHSAKIDEEFTDKEKKIIKSALIEMGAEIDKVDKIMEESEKKEKDSSQILTFTREIKNIDSKISRGYLTSELKGKIYDKSPWLDFMPLYDSDSRELPRLIKTLGGEAWHPKRKDINKDMIKISHVEGLPVNVWTVNEKYEMLRMIEYGVDGIITDYPLRLKKLCEENGINWF